MGLIFASVMYMFLKIYNDPSLKWKQASVCIMAIIYTMTEASTLARLLAWVGGSAPFDPSQTFRRRCSRSRPPRALLAEGSW